MKGQELRIGNFISDIHASESYYSEVIELDTKHCYYGNFHSSYSDLKPIPITKDILIRLGFNNVFEEDYQAGNIVVEFNEKCTYVYIVCPMPWIELEHIKYVHQLQNLYFALTGEELTFKSE